MVAHLLCVGDLNADLTIRTAGGIAPGSDTAGSVVMSGGGSAANVAAWAADAGAPARFVGAVGDDPLGDFLVDELASHGVDVCAVRRAATPSRAVAVIVGPDGDRSMVSALDPATVLSVEDVDAAWFDDVAWLHLTAYTYVQLAGRSVFERLVGEAIDRALPWSIDPSSANMLATGELRNDVHRAWSGAAVLFPNQDEAAWLADTTDPLVAGERLLEVAETVVVTCGADGAIVARRGADTLRVAAVPTETVNTLGCGDAFSGGFLVGRLGGLDDGASAARAALSASGAAGMASSR